MYIWSPTAFLQQVIKKQERRGTEVMFSTHNSQVGSIAYKSLKADVKQNSTKSSDDTEYEQIRLDNLFHKIDSYLLLKP